MTGILYRSQGSQSCQQSCTVLLSSCGAQAFSLIETLLAPIAITDETVTFKAIQTAVLAHLHPKNPSFRMAHIVFHDAETG